MRDLSFTRTYALELEQQNHKLREVLRQAKDQINSLLPLAERMQAACDSGESKNYDNDWDAADARSYHGRIVNAKQFLETIRQLKP
jgi:hypothetical protein